MAFCVLGHLLWLACYINDCPALVIQPTFSIRFLIVSVKEISNCLFYFIIIESLAVIHRHLPTEKYNKNEANIYQALVIKFYICNKYAKWYIRYSGRGSRGARGGCRGRGKNRLILLSFAGEMKPKEGVKLQAFTYSN